MTQKRIKYFYPLGLLQPGDSFFVPCLDTEAVSAEVRDLAKQMRMRIIIRKEITDGFYGIRVWRSLYGRAS